MDTGGQVLVSIVSGVFVAAVASATTAHLAFRRFYSERWWERKASAYGSIIETLYELSYAPMRLWTESTDSDIPNANQAELDELQERYEVAMKAVRKAVAMGSYVISRRAVEILRGFQKEESEGWAHARSEHAPQVGYFHTHRAASGALELMRAEARRDLRVDQEL